MATDNIGDSFCEREDDVHLPLIPRARDTEFEPYFAEENGEKRSSELRRSLAVWDSRQIRTPYEFNMLHEALSNARTENERSRAEVMITLARMEDDELNEVRANTNIKPIYRQLAFEEYAFRSNRAALEDARERNRNLRVSDNNALPHGRDLEIPARLVLEYLRTHGKRSPSEFYQWCRRLAVEIAITLPALDVKISKESDVRNLRQVEFELILENENGEPTTDGIFLWRLGKGKSKPKFYKEKTLKNTYDRYSSSEIL